VNIKAVFLIIVILFCFAQNYAEIRTIHVYVALCDNIHQKIVEVPARFGNGQKAEGNLYWGSGGGMRTFFRRSEEWDEVTVIKNPSDIILERVIFKHKTSNVYLMADAYDGAEIKQTITDFFQACNGTLQASVSIDTISLDFAGKADLIAYIGHDWLMDFDLDLAITPDNSQPRDALILSCISKTYFADNLRKTGAEPLLWTTGLMAPEAYTLKAALDGWMLNENNDQIKERAAQAYNNYQHCGIGSARNLLVTGW